ncbi:MAG: hypothetical protein SGI72_16770 [Planctomycetota bacterium]|nr:hypothetical protein [Planctomycetota bacterium]
MSSGKSLKIGVAAVVVLIAALIWFLRERPPVTPVGVQSSPAAQSDPTPAAPATTLTSPERPVTPAVDGRQGVPAVTERVPVKVQPPVEEPVEPPLVLPPGGSIEKPESLVPVYGGSEAMPAQFAGSTYATRYERLRMLEAVFELGSPDEGQMKAFAALKDELGWLRANLGQPEK